MWTQSLASCFLGRGSFRCPAAGRGPAREAAAGGDGVLTEHAGLQMCKDKADSLPGRSLRLRRETGHKIFRSKDTVGW